MTIPAATHATIAGGSKTSTMQAAMAPANVAAHPKPSQSTFGPVMEEMENFETVFMLIAACYTKF